MPVIRSPKQDNNTNWGGDKIEKWQLHEIRSGVFSVVLILIAALAYFVFEIHPLASLLIAGILAVAAVFCKPLINVVAKIMLEINMRR